MTLVFPATTRAAVDSLSEPESPSSVAPVLDRLRLKNGTATRADDLTAVVVCRDAAS